MKNKEKYAEQIVEIVCEYDYSLRGCSYYDYC